MGCELEIYDHGGVVPTAKNAVFRVERPRTPMGDAPFIELYNPTKAVIEDCARMVDSVGRCSWLSNDAGTRIYPSGQHTSRFSH